MSSFIFWFQGPDTLCLYPGGPDFFVSDDFTETYRRLSEPLSQFQERTDLPIRPAKAIAPVFEEMPIGRQIRLSTVMDRALHRAFIQYLPITSKQVGALEPEYRSDSRQSPLGVIGDLDGDGFEDAAIYRQVGGEHRVIWVLTAGDSIGVTSISLPGPPAVFGETPTTSYLKYVPPGTAIKEAGGGVARLKWAAIELISKQGGNSRIFYVDGQKIRTGARL